MLGKRFLSKKKPQKRKSKDCVITGEKVDGVTNKHCKICNTYHNAKERCVREITRRARIQLSKQNTFIVD